MESAEAKCMENSPLKTHKSFMVSQILLRLLAAAASLAAAWVMLTSKQSTVAFSIQVEAKYSYSAAFKFFAYANLIACAFSLLSMCLAFILARKASNYFYMFLHDLVVMTLLMAGCAAASAIGYVGKNGMTQAGWMAICDHFDKFCDRVTVALVVSYLAFAIYFALAIISAHKSRQIHGRGC